MENIRPLHDRVLVRKIAPPKVSQGGIIIPDQAQERDREQHLLGKVLAVGPGFKCDDGSVRHPDCEVGDTVLFAQFGKTPFESEGDKLLMLRYEHVHAVVTD